MPGTSPSPFTIDAATMQNDYESAYELMMVMAGFGEDYVLNNGSSWESGAGSARQGRMSLDHITRDGPWIRYHMAVDDLMIERTDYDSGDHSAHFRLETLGEWTMVAEYGSKTAKLLAWAVITTDEPANYRDERFNYLSAPLCSAVPVASEYVLRDSSTFTENLFDSQFGYEIYTVVDFTSHWP